MKKKHKRRMIFAVAVILMLLAIWAYVASLDDSEPLDTTLPQLAPYDGGDR